jgi:hypothetical protein
MNNNKEIEKLLKILHQKVVSKFDKEYLVKEGYSIIFGTEPKVKRDKTIKAYYKLVIEDMDKYPLYFKFTRHTRYNKHSVTDSFIGVNLQLRRKIAAVSKYQRIRTLGNYADFRYFLSGGVTKNIHSPFSATFKGLETDIVAIDGEQTVKNIIEYIKDPSSMTLVNAHKHSSASIIPTNTVRDIDKVLNIETSQTTIAKLMRDMRKMGVDVKKAGSNKILLKNTDYSPMHARNTMVGYNQFKDKLTENTTREEYEQLIADSYLMFLKLMIELVDSITDRRDSLKWDKDKK